MPKREEILGLLNSKGFTWTYEACSQVDDWHVNGIAAKSTS